MKGIKEVVLALVPILAFLAILWLMLLSLKAEEAHCQILTTAETLGSGKQAVLLTENHQFVDGVHLNVAYVQYIRGLSDRFDLYLIAGETNVKKKAQAWLGIGGNFNLFQVQGFDTSLFNTIALPINARDQSSTVLLNTAFVISRGFEKLTPYAGVSALVPIGARNRGFFTPIREEVNVPLGIFVPWRQWGVFLEGDVGHLSAVGVGISYGF
ncbi:MAG: hypothetical protein AAB691_02895 [Patescibacteria group bacterium]